MKKNIRNITLFSLFAFLTLLVGCYNEENLFPRDNEFDPNYNASVRFDEFILKEAASVNDSRISYLEKGSSEENAALGNTGVPLVLRIYPNIPLDENEIANVTIRAGWKGPNATSYVYTSFFHFGANVTGVANLNGMMCLRSMVKCNKLALA